MKSQLNLLLEIDVKLELIQVDGNGVNFSIFRHFFISSKLLKTKEILSGARDTKKSDGSNRQKPYHVP